MKASYSTWFSRIFSRDFGCSHSTATDLFGSKRYGLVYRYWNRKDISLHISIYASGEIRLRREANNMRRESHKEKWLEKSMICLKTFPRHPFLSTTFSFDFRSLLWLLVSSFSCYDATNSLRTWLIACMEMIPFRDSTFFLDGPVVLPKLGNPCKKGGENLG